MVYPHAPDLSLVVPTYNERGNIEALIRDLENTLAHRPHEIIVVDDDSPDGTWRLVENLCREYPNLRLARRQSQRDLVRSILLGFSIAKGRILGCMDADGSHPSEAIPQLLALIDSGFDLVIGSRYVAEGSISDWPMARRLLSRVATMVTRRILNLPIHDPMSGLYLLRKEIYSRANVQANSRGYKALPELFVKGRPLTVAEVPICFRNRRLGKSKLTLKSVYFDMLGILSLMWFQWTQKIR
jgi:dolichol-phosphate mannosyltransferase